MFNIVGGVSWIFSMTFIGYFLGKIFDAKQIEKVIYLIIFVSVAPVAYGAIKNWLTTRKQRGTALTSETVTEGEEKADAKAAQKKAATDEA